MATSPDGEGIIASWPIAPEGGREIQAGAIAIVISVSAPMSVPDSWTWGPLPLSGRVPGPTGYETIVATTERRRTAFHTRVHELLYPGSRAKGLRAHRELERSERFAVCDSVWIDALELLAIRDFLPDRGRLQRGAPGFLVLHGLLPEVSLDLVKTLNVTLRQRYGREAALRQLSGSPILRSAAIAPDLQSLPFTVLFGIPDCDGALSRAQDEGNVPTDDTTLEGWSWLLASLTPPEAFTPDQRGADMGVVLWLSTSWCVRVLRNGVAFIARGDDDETNVIPSLVLYVRTIYLDLFLLGLIQSRWLNDIADLIGMTAVGDSREAEFIEKLDMAMTRFRAAVWWKTVATGSHADRLMEAFQAEHRLPELLTYSSSEIDAIVRQSRSQIERQTLVASRRTEKIAALFTTTLPILTVWAGLNHSWAGLGVAFGVCIGAGAAAMFLMRTRHGAFNVLGKEGGRGEDSG